MALYFQTNPYQQPLIAAKQELVQRRQELNALTQRIAWLENSIAALEPLAGKSTQQFDSLGDILRAVLSTNSGKEMTIADIRYVMDSMGIKITSSPAVIGVTLRRMAAKPESGIIWIPAPTLGQPVRFMWNESVSKPSTSLPLQGEI